MTELQQQFLALRFGMYIHLNMATYEQREWGDPKASPALFNPKALATDLAIIKAQMVDMGAEQLPVDFQWGSQQAAIFEKIENYLVNAGQISAPIAPTDLFTNAFAAQYNQFDHSTIVNQARNWK